MCYDAVSATRQSLKYAIHRGDVHHIEELTRKLEDLLLAGLKTFYYVSGFTHPGLLVFTNEKPYEPQVFTWGLIPSWVKDRKAALLMMNQTLNARAETIFEKPAFRGPAKNKRCLIYLDAFYEHHHANNQTYPFHISMKDDLPLVVAGLWEEWVDRSTGEILKTAAIVTTMGNPLMSVIHNNPKADGARMPVILDKSMQDQWLAPCLTEEDEKNLKALLVPFDESKLKAYTTARLKGKNAFGNLPGVEAPVKYAELAIKEVRADIFI